MTRSLTRRSGIEGLKESAVSSLQVVGEAIQVLLLLPDLVSERLHFLVLALTNGKVLACALTALEGVTVFGQPAIAARFSMNGSLLKRARPHHSCDFARLALSFV